MDGNLNTETGKIKMVQGRSRMRMKFRYTPEYFRIKLERIRGELENETSADRIIMLKNMEAYHENQQRDFENARRAEAALQQGIHRAPEES